MDQAWDLVHGNWLPRAMLRQRINRLKLRLRDFRTHLAAEKRARKTRPPNARGMPYRGPRREEPRMPPGLQIYIEDE